MSHDHEDELKRHQENSFITLHEKIDSLKQYIKVFIDEPQKFDQENYNKLVKDVDDAEAECKRQVDAYIQHLEKNVDSIEKASLGHHNVRPTFSSLHVKDSLLCM